jgi:segregation and condensation protein B
MPICGKMHLALQPAILPGIRANSVRWMVTVGLLRPPLRTGKEPVVDQHQFESLLESLLFVADEPVAVSQLAKVLEVEPKSIEEALERLRAEYGRRGLRIQRKGERVQMVTAPEAAPHIERFLGLRLSGKLSTAALETLAIIAYQQPITRAQIEAVRGVNCDGVLRTLTSKGLIEEIGRLKQAGRPILYGTTFEFLQYFGLQDLAELPPLEGEGDEEEKEEENETVQRSAP